LWLRADIIQGAALKMLEMLDVGGVEGVDLEVRSLQTRIRKTWIKGE